MDIKAQWSKASTAFDARPPAERVILAVVILAILVWVYVVAFHDPVRAEIATAERQLQTSQSRINAMQTRMTQARIRAGEDPAQAARNQLEQLAQEQLAVRREIELLTGNLVSPDAMTRLLTSALESQPGLRLLRVENKAPLPLRESASESQVYRHALVLEFQGDYLSTLQYLRFLEGLSQSLFWDVLHFRQTEWPSGNITLELHTLSAEEGFVGV